MTSIRQTICSVIALAVLPVLFGSQPTPEQVAYQLTIRYTPYADGAAVLDPELVAARPFENWWSTPEDIQANRCEDAAPLAGLHLAIDPGHIGGAWAEWEGRNFRIADTDFWVREGELVLEVAQRVRQQLIELGAQVTLLRESAVGLNPRPPVDYWDEAFAELELPSVWTWARWVAHARAVQSRAVRLSIVIGELAERARLVNQEIQPDALLSLHINAAPWSNAGCVLVDSNHSHVLIFGCLSAEELAAPGQVARLIEKISNGSGLVEVALGKALGKTLEEATGLPPSDYDGQNAIRISVAEPSLWARNLMLLRLVDCPTVLLEPYIANSHGAYSRIQDALAIRAAGGCLPEDDILLEYTQAVVNGVLQVYGSVD